MKKTDLEAFLNKELADKAASNEINPVLKQAFKSEQQAAATAVGKKVKSVKKLKEKAIDKNGKKK